MTFRAHLFPCMGITIAVLFLPSTFFSVVWIALHWYVIVGGIAGMILLDDEYEDWIVCIPCCPRAAPTLARESDASNIGYQT